MVDRTKDSATSSWSLTFINLAILIFLAKYYVCTDKLEQAERWPMSTLKVSNYNKHNEIIIVHISMPNSSNLPIVQQTYYEMTAMTSCYITESVAVTRIDIYPAGEEPDRHAIRLTLIGSRVWQPSVSPYYVEIGPLLPGWSIGPRPHSPSKNKSITWSREVRFDIVVTKAPQLIGPHKFWHAISTHLKAYHRGQNDTVLNRHGRCLPHRNLGIATSLSPPFSSKCSTDPPTDPVHSSNNNNHNLYSSYPKYHSSP
jgi:hypothetical protein